MAGKTERPLATRWGSTRSFVAEARRTRGYGLFDLLHGLFYARWPYFYIGVGTGEHALSSWIRPLLAFAGRFAPQRTSASGAPVTAADGYHGKVVPLDAARQLVQVREDIRLENLERVVPYALARDIVLRDPDHLAALECPCRAARADPCRPLDVCLIVGEPFASFVLAHHPRRARGIDAEEAVSILEAEHARGHVHHAFFKDAMLGRFYAVCNCCPCCCGAMQAMRNGTPMLSASGYTCRVRDEECVGCAECAEACPFDALRMQDGLAVVDGRACMGCGVCVSRCPAGALALDLDPTKGVSLLLDALRTGLPA